MRKALITILMTVAGLQAQTVKQAIHLTPTVKGLGLVATATEPAPTRAIVNNGITYHGGPVMRASVVHAYFIWYGNWTNGPHASDSETTVNLMNILFGPTRGIGGSSYFKINTSYSDTVGHPTGNVALVASTTNRYSRGRNLADADVQTIVNSAISSGSLPRDANGIYFVLTSSDVAETSGFCNQYCGWHTHSIIGGSDIKYAFVGNSDRCPASCEMQSVSPNRDSGADGMASVMAHEAAETVTNPDLNAWFDSAGNESADKCAWKFGPVTGVVGQGAYNQTFGTYNWLIQMDWENSRGGGCDKSLGGKFYSR